MDAACNVSCNCFATSVFAAAAMQSGVLPKLLRPSNLVTFHWSLMSQIFVNAPQLPHPHLMHHPCSCLIYNQRLWRTVGCAVEQRAGTDEGRRQTECQAVGAPSHTALPWLWQPHPEERRLQPHVLLCLPPTVLLGKTCLAAFLPTAFVSSTCLPFCLLCFCLCAFCPSVYCLSMSVYSSHLSLQFI